MEKQKNSGKGLYDLLMKKVSSFPKKWSDGKDYKNYEMASNILNNYISCWKETSDSNFRNKNYNYLSDRDPNPDPVALKLSNLMKFYNQRISNQFRSSEKRKKDRKRISKYVGFGKLEMRDRVMRKEKYFYIFETPEKDIIKKLI